MKGYLLLVFAVICLSLDQALANKGGDLILFGGGKGKGCSPGLIKDGGKDDKGTDILMLPGKCKKKMEMKKIEFVPYPVKEYVPIPVEKKHMEMPMEHMSMEHMPMEMPMEMPHMDEDMGFGYGGFESRKHVTRVNNNNRRNPVNRMLRNRRQ